MTTKTDDTIEATVVEHEKPVPFQKPLIYTFQDEYEFLTESLKIDRHKIPELLENQCELVDFAGEFLNKASRQLNQIKLLVDTREAEIYLQIRREAERESKKLTEAELTARVASHVEIVGLKQARLEAEDVKNRWLNRKGAYETRGRDLHDEVELITCGYSRHN